MMETHNMEKPDTSRGLKIAAAFALVFGIVTLFSAGNVLFGSDEARELVGNYIPFVVWFNFCAGLFYIIAAYGIWLGKHWAFGLSVIITVATFLAAISFGFMVIQDSAFEMRTVGALALRIGFWAVISWVLSRTLQRSLVYAADP